MIHRRSFLIGLGSLIAAPAIVRAASLMPVKQMPPRFWLDRMREESIYHGVPLRVVEELRALDEFRKIHPVRYVSRIISPSPVPSGVVVKGPWSGSF